MYAINLHIYLEMLTVLNLNHMDTKKHHVIDPYIEILCHFSLQILGLYF